MTTVSDIYRILRDVQSKGGGEEYKVELEGNPSDENYSKMFGYLKTAGFTVLNNDANDSNGDDNRKTVMVLNRESYDELRIKEAIKLIQESDPSKTTTPTSSSRGKKSNYIDKSLKMEEDIAKMRAEKAERYKNSERSARNNANSNRGDQGTGNNNGTSSGGTSASSSLRRFMNFDWFTSMFSSRRSGGGEGNRRNRQYLDSNYYRSKNTGCCGPSCGS